MFTNVFEIEIATFTKLKTYKQDHYLANKGKNKIVIGNNLPIFSLESTIKWLFCLLTSYLLHFM